MFTFVPTSAAVYHGKVETKGMLTIPFSAEGFTTHSQKECRVRERGDLRHIHVDVSDKDHENTLVIGPEESQGGQPT